MTEVTVLLSKLGVCSIRVIEYTYLTKVPVVTMMQTTQIMFPYPTQYNTYNY